MRAPKAPFESWYTAVPESGCWLWTGGLLWNGYGAFKHQGHPRRAHRVSWELANGPIPEGMQVLHTCDVRSCVNPDHLFLGSQLANMHDMIRKGRKVASPGERNGMAKLTAAQAAEIRADTRVQRAIAQDYGVSQSLVSLIKLGVTWTQP